MDASDSSGVLAVPAPLDAGPAQQDPRRAAASLQARLDVALEQLASCRDDFEPAGAA